MADENELTTWQEIAQHLNVSIRTAQNYEKKASLPVRRMPGARGRVLAYRADLDRWKAEQLVLTSPLSTSPVNGLDVVKAVDLEVPSSRRALLGAVVAIAGAGIVFPVVRSVWPARQPVAYRTLISTLIALDGQGQEVWRHEFPQGLINGAFDQEPGHTMRCYFADIDGDGEVEVLFAYCPVNRGATGDTLICFSRTGKEKWRFTPGRPIVIDGSGNRYAPPYFIGSVQAIADKRERKTRIIVSSNHYMLYPDQVVALDGTGKQTGEYWHPGHLLHMTHADLDGDGNDELLIAGVNNAYHAATLLIFDPGKLGGASSFFTDYRLHLTGFAPGTEKAAVFFPRTCVGRLEPYNRVWELKVIDNRIYAAVVEATAEENPRKILYELDSKLRVLSAMPTVEFQAAHRELEKAGTLDHALSDQEVERWKKAVIVNR